MFSNFADLNKACPKDPFSLPYIDTLVDAMAVHKMISFLDAFLGYNQILMHQEDHKKTAIITAKGIYRHIAMPFGLKNVGSTYQRLVNGMFANHIRRTMEVYIDEMIVKSKQSKDHTKYLQQTFAVLRRCSMKLNPAKYMDNFKPNMTLYR